MKPIEKEFSQGVKILLERMENNPEDFVGTDEPPYSPPKFGMFADLMRDVVRGNRVKDWEDWYLFTKEEQAALIQGYKNMMRSRFDRGIMQKLLEEPEEKVRFGKKDYNLGTPLTADQITQHALDVLKKEYSRVIDESMLKGNYTPPPATPKKFLLNPSQMTIAQKMGMSPYDYAKKINAPKV